MTVYDYFGKAVPISKNSTKILDKNSAVTGVLTGTSGSDTLTATNADLKLIGGAGDDRYHYVDSKDQIVEDVNGGIDTVLIQEITNRGNYYVLPKNIENAELAYGTSITGNALSNYIKGNASYQVLDGGTGNDVLTGGGGGDVFVFKAQSGYDVVTDFHTSGVSDKIRLTGYDQFKTFADVKSSLTQVGNDVVLKLSNTDAVKLLDVKVSDLTEKNFQMHFDTSKLTQSFGDEFDTLSLWDGRQGTWRTDYGWGDNRDGLIARTLTGFGEKEIYIDPWMKGAGTTAIGISPFTVENGVVTIHAERTPSDLKDELYGYNFTSGMMSTRNSFVQTYGYFEASIEITGDKGTWPAFWLYAQDPYKINSTATGTKFEIDILENWGTDGTDIAQATMHTYAENGSDKPVAFKTFDGDLTEGFHTYGVLWTAEKITWYLDGVEVGSTPTPADGHGPMYIIVNMALDKNTPADFQSSEMSIDYVRAFTLNEPAPAKYAALDEIQNFIGTSANNSFYVRNEKDTVTEKENGGTDMVQSAVNYKLGANLENLSLVGNALEGTGNELKNTLLGNDRNNLLSGGGGNDYLDGRAGGDIMVGGTGDDLYVVDNVGDRIVELSGEGKDTVMSSAWYYGLADNVENLNLTGAAIYGIGNDLDNRIIGNQLNNTLVGGAGNDFLDGGTGYDTMQGGTGNDSYIVDNAWDKLVENANEGTDTVYVRVSGYVIQNNFENAVLQTGAVSVYGNADKNFIVGNELDNNIWTYGGNDTIIGGAGADTMAGGEGDDWYDVDNVSDRIIEGLNQGSDTVNSKVDYTLAVYVENLRLDGLAVKGTGNTLNNTITGNGLANIIDGKAGNDYINGGKGADTLTGGTGADIFVFKTADKDGTVDTITDFKISEHDQIDLSDLFSGHDVLQEGIDHFIKMTTSNGQTTLSVDTSGSGNNFEALAKFAAGLSGTVSDLEHSGHIVV